MHEIPTQHHNTHDSINIRLKGMDKSYCYFTISILARAALIFPANFFEKQEAKSKEEK